MHFVARVQPRPDFLTGISTFADEDAINEEGQQRRKSESGDGGRK